MTELSTMLVGIPFPSCLMNASGAWSWTHEELRDLAAEVGHAGELLWRHRIDVCVCHTPQLAAFVPAVNGALDLIAERSTNETSA